MVIDKINYIGNGKYKIRIHQRKYRWYINMSKHRQNRRKKQRKSIVNKDLAVGLVLGYALSKHWL
jgi:hypothetical protein